MDSSDYFESYQDLSIHQIMLRDAPRNKAYKQAIFDNADQILGRRVLDVGAGTGILSVFCAQAGAAKVYAVEASNVSKIAREVIKENGFDKVIEVINSRIEDTVLPEKVDIIVSEWMGFYLLHEGMLDSVIFARDKFLKPGGLMFPESATIYSAPCCVPSMFDSWGNIEGVSMKSFSEKLRTEASHKPSTVSVAKEHILADPEVLLWIDLREVTQKEVDGFKVQHIAVATKAGKYQGICLWFTCTFPSFVTEPVTLSTAPEDPETHWKQTTIVLPTEIQVEQKAPIAYELSLARAQENPRRYNIEVTMLDPAEVEHPEYCACHMTKCILVWAMLEKYEKESMGK
ncbi:protein arginine N-methyltransferase 6 isoform X1 [Tribolium castaneum]|uniref:protein arginine N-methyltransferase 6 isoform X1 n=1 Tax=Tribolium castaneum TaxID=7070 RepID=UPI00046C3A57|nr:PREDICTED: protein arginine N-methyltransferase 6 [Tribolium castaneum]|eukprot:XP_008195284.1 PREDICTED: protein arginine N-methyltransferase 6 [Tribolium castaneum]